MKINEGEMIRMAYNIAYSNKFRQFFIHDEKIEKFISEKVGILIESTAFDYILDSQRDIDEFKNNKILTEEVGEVIRKKIKEIYEDKVILTYVNFD